MKKKINKESKNEFIKEAILKLLKNPSVAKSMGKKEEKEWKKN